MNLYNIIYMLPVGTRVFLKNDGKNIAREVIGYEWFYNTGNIIFKDGYKLNMNCLDQIAVVDQKAAHFNMYC